MQARELQEMRPIDDVFSSGEPPDGRIAKPSAPQ
jgi:hypothetical protein